MSNEPFGQYETGTVIQIGTRRFALHAWDDQPCDDEIVYEGYSQADWSLSVEASSIVVNVRDKGWYWTDASNTILRHDKEGLRAVGTWHTGKATIIKNPGKSWGFIRSESDE